MKISEEFSKHALEYEAHNIIQNKVINKLLKEMKSRPKYILDLGCGNGSLCKNISWEFEQFVGVDFASAMLELHPNAANIEVMYGDFNDSTLFKVLESYEFEHIFSASALQWSKDLETLFSDIAKLKTKISLAIFTSGTFKTLHTEAGIAPLLRDKEEINRLQKKYFNAAFEVVKYKLEFKSVREMFRYIKSSGVSGSRNILSYTQTKKLMREYPIDYLEFEVVFITS
ncbi:methyltransferase domain-containing protein [Sulfurimonas sp. SAG-AH-194-C20]|nr:methyltransferase domain-containing protein [Sulfurimonas sp. SAG-AH-194-C20]MDF1879100.1 methyltransferase domain-containing protein [Sulfurimonas sp. SAG-AH-194-C20]